MCWIGSTLAASVLNLSLLLHLLNCLLELFQFFIFSLLGMKQFFVELLLILESLNRIFEDTNLAKNLFIDLVGFCLLLL